MGEKKSTEKYFHELVDVYFQFYKDRHRDEDGFKLSPDWNSKTRGMEAAALKKIISTLREIAEGKDVEWTLEYAKERFVQFLERAYSKPFFRKNFLLVMLNKFKNDILSGIYLPNLNKKILELWYFEFPAYAVDHEKDKYAADVIIGFFKQQYVLASIQFTEESVLSSFRTIVHTIKEDDFWRIKSLKSISNNLQEFVNRIKSKKNGNIPSRGIEEIQRVRTKSKSDFGKL